jgi:hypothetical protein
VGVTWWFWVLSCLCETNASIGKGKAPFHTMQAYKGSRSITAHVILDRGEWSASRPGRFAPGREPRQGRAPQPV